MALPGINQSIAVDILPGIPGEVANSGLRRLVFGIDYTNINYIAWWDYPDGAAISNLLTVPDHQANNPFDTADNDFNRTYLAGGTGRPESVGAHGDLWWTVGRYQRSGASEGRVYQQRVNSAGTPLLSFARFELGVQADTKPLAVDGDKLWVWVNNKFREYAITTGSDGVATAVTFVKELLATDTIGGVVPPTPSKITGFDVANGKAAFITSDSKLFFNGEEVDVPANAAAVVVDGSQYGQERAIVVWFGSTVSGGAYLAQVETYDLNGNQVGDRAKLPSTANRLNNSGWTEPGLITRRQAATEAVKHHANLTLIELSIESALLAVNQQGQSVLQRPAKHVATFGINQIAAEVLELSQWHFEYGGFRFEVDSLSYQNDPSEDTVDLKVEAIG